MVVAAAFAGALLLATPFVVAGAQKDEAKPESREAAAAWKGDGRAGGYVPGTDPDSPEGKQAAGGDKPGGTQARGDKGPVGDVRPDTGDRRKPADGSAEAETKGSKGSTTGAADKTEKSGSGDKAPAGTGSDAPTKAPSAGSAPKSAPTVVYSGVSGPECPTQRFQKSGYYSDGKEGWATHSGGFGGYGCAGKYLSMPMSGSSSKDSGGSATWLFDLPATARKCSISVHVPGSSDIVRVGGNPSYYTVYDRFLPRTSNLVGSYYVRQHERRGTWYNVPGTFPVDAKKLSVQLHDRGEDNNYEHHAISALKVTCTG
jgi:translation initiation factor IF-2